MIGSPEPEMKIQVVAKTLGGANFPELQKYWFFFEAKEWIP